MDHPHPPRKSVHQSNNIRSLSSLPRPSPLQSILGKPPRKKKKRTFNNSFLHTRPRRPRRRHIIELEHNMISSPGPYPFPSSLASPSDLGLVKRFLKGKWVPSKMDFIVDSAITDDTIPGVPKSFELLALADHFYVQQISRKDFPAAISTQLGSIVSNRYQVMCGDTRNRIYYGVAKYPICTGWLAGYRPFRLFIMDHNLDIVLNFEKSISCLLLCCFGGFGTKIHISGPGGELFGTIIQRFSHLCPYFDILDADNQPIFYIKGPPIIPFSLHYLPFLSKFKLYRHDFQNAPELVGVYLESSYGVGSRNVKNCLRVGFPRNIPFQQKSLILASLFQLFFTYYELGEEFQGGAWFRQQLRPLLRINPFFATRLNRPYGYVVGKCNPYLTVLVLGGIACLLIWFVLIHDGDNYSSFALDAPD